MYMKEWKLFPKMADVGNEDWAYHSSSHRAPCVTTVYKLPTPTSDLLTQTVKTIRTFQAFPTSGMFSELCREGPITNASWLP